MTDIERQAGAEEIEVTEEMIEEGANLIETWSDVLGATFLARDVYIAMEKIRLQASTEANSLMNFPKAK